MPPDSHRLTTPDQILQEALRKETQARDFYAALAMNCSVRFVRDLLEKLENEESKHMSMIQKMIERLESGRDVV
jgi:rubrerythrin